MKTAVRTVLDALLAIYVGGVVVASGAWCASSFTPKVKGWVIYYPLLAAALGGGLLFFWCLFDTYFREWPDEVEREHWQKHIFTDFFTFGLDKKRFLLLFVFYYLSVLRRGLGGEFFGAPWLRALTRKTPPFLLKTFYHLTVDFFFRFSLSALATAWLSARRSGLVATVSLNLLSLWLFIVVLTGVLFLLLVVNDMVTRESPYPLEELREYYRQVYSRIW